MDESSREADASKYDGPVEIEVEGAPSLDPIRLPLPFLHDIRKLASTDAQCEACSGGCGGGGVCVWGRGGGGGGGGG